MAALVVRLVTTGAAVEAFAVEEAVAGVALAVALTVSVAVSVVVVVAVELTLPALDGACDCESVWAAIAALLLRPLLRGGSMAGDVSRVA